MYNVVYNYYLTTWYLYIESGTEITSTPAAAVDLHAAFQEESTKAVMKVPVIHAEVLNISLKEFASLVIVENAPYNYKKYVNKLSILHICYNKYMIYHTINLWLGITNQ